MMTINGRIKKTKTPIRLGARKAAETALALRSSLRPRLLSVSSTRGFLIFGFFSFLRSFVSFILIAGVPPEVRTYRLSNVFAVKTNNLIEMFHNIIIYFNY